MKRLSGTRKGFTFLEIMFVVVIIGILVGIAVPSLTGKSKKARIIATRATMKGIETALQDYEMNVGGFPTSEQGLEALVKCPSDVAPEDWGDNQYLKEIPKDAWNQEFIFKCPGEHNSDYDLSSKGPDRQEGTDDDIKNWKDEGGQL